MDTNADVTINFQNQGIEISGIGDVNNDSYDDVIVGSADWNEAYIYYGGANMDSVSDLILKGEYDGDYFGMSVSGAGDVNSDGYDDVIVGAPNYPGHGYNGRAYVYFGGKNINNI